MAAHGYFFPISDHVLTLKDDGTFYRFQVTRTGCFIIISMIIITMIEPTVILCCQTLLDKGLFYYTIYEESLCQRLKWANRHAVGCR